MNVLDQETLEFLQQFKDYFSEALLGDIPPEREEDHAIMEIPGSSPLNRALYRVSAAHQEETMSQVNKLLEKGLI